MTTHSVPSPEASSAPAAELFALRVVRNALEHLPVDVVLFDAGARVAFASTPLRLALGASAKGWALAVALRGEPVRNGVVQVQATFSSRRQLRGHIRPVHDAARVLRGAVMVVEDASTDVGIVRALDGGAKDPLVSLTPRERDVFRLVATGERTRAVALHLGITPKTVETHRAAIHRKLGLTSLADLVRLATSLELGRPGLAPATIS